MSLDLQSADVVILFDSDWVRHGALFVERSLALSNNFNLDHRIRKRISRRKTGLIGELCFVHFCCC